MPPRISLPSAFRDKLPPAMQAPLDSRLRRRPR
jgi:hypothetical protein